MEILILALAIPRFAKSARIRGRSGAWGFIGMGLFIAAELAGLALGMRLGLDKLAMYWLALASGMFALLTAWMALLTLSPRSRVEGSAPRAMVESRHYDPSNPYTPPRHEPV